LELQKIYECGFKAVFDKNNIKKAKTMISIGQKIAKGTGTTLSSADREIG
jgi:hypothetical protein